MDMELKGKRLTVFEVSEDSTGFSSRPDLVIYNFRIFSLIMLEFSSNFFNPIFSFKLGQSEIQKFISASWHPSMNFCAIGFVYNCKGTTRLS